MLSTAHHGHAASFVADLMSNRCWIIAKCDRVFHPLLVFLRTFSARAIKSFSVPSVVAHPSVPLSFLVVS